MYDRPKTLDYPSVGMLPENNPMPGQPTVKERLNILEQSNKNLTLHVQSLENSMKELTARIEFIGQQIF